MEPAVSRCCMRGIDGRDNPDGEDVEYPPPQPLDGEIDREMDTDGDLASDGAIPPDSNDTETHSKHPASEPIAEGAGDDDAEDVDEIGSEDEEEEEEEEEGDISLDEEDLEEEDLEGEDDEMQDVDAAEGDGDGDEDVTMQSVENSGPAGKQAVAQSS